MLWIKKHYRDLGPEIGADGNALHKKTATDIGSKIDLVTQQLLLEKSLFGRYCQIAYKQKTSRKQLQNT